MDEKKVTLFNKFYSNSKDKVYESLENSVFSFIKATLPPPGIVQEIHKNWAFLISQIKSDKDASDYIVKNSYPKCLKKMRNGESILYIYASNSSIASFFKNNSEIMVNNINILFKKVVVNKIRVQTH